MEDRRRVNDQNREHHNVQLGFSSEDSGLTCGKPYPWGIAADKPGKEYSTNSIDRDKLFHNVQDMFKGQVDAEVVHMVLTERQWNAEDAIEKLLFIAQDSSVASQALSLKTVATTLEQSTAREKDTIKETATAPQKRLKMAEFRHSVLPCARQPQMSDEALINMSPKTPYAAVDIDPFASRPSSEQHVRSALHAFDLYANNMGEQPSFTGAFDASAASSSAYDAQNETLFNVDDLFKTLTPTDFDSATAARDNRVLQQRPMATNASYAEAAAVTKHRSPPAEAPSGPRVFSPTKRRAMGHRKPAISLNPQERESLEQLIEEVIIGGVESESSTSDDDASVVTPQVVSDSDNGASKSLHSQIKVAQKHMKNPPPRFVNQPDKAEVGPLGDMALSGVPNDVMLQSEAAPEGKKDDRWKKQEGRTRNLLGCLDTYFEDGVQEDEPRNNIRTSTSDFSSKSLEPTNTVAEVQQRTMNTKLEELAAKMAQNDVGQFVQQAKPPRPDVMYTQPHQQQFSVDAPEFFPRPMHPIGLPGRDFRPPRLPAKNQPRFPLHPIHSAQIRTVNDLVRAKALHGGRLASPVQVAPPTMAAAGRRTNSPFQTPYGRLSPQLAATLPAPSFVVGQRSHSPSPVPLGGTAGSASHKASAAAPVGLPPPPPPPQLANPNMVNMLSYPVHPYAYAGFVPYIPTLPRHEAWVAEPKPKGRGAVANAKHPAAAAVAKAGGSDARPNSAPTVLPPKFASYLPGHAHIVRPQATVSQVVDAATALTRVKAIEEAGNRLMVLMRGAPGSGKSTLAKELIGASGVVISADDYFMRGNVYKYDVTRIHDAHESCRAQALKLVRGEKSPIVVDNTNMMMWEMTSYVEMALKNGYVVEIYEADTPWRMNSRELAQHTLHGVPMEKIQQMLDRFDQVVTFEGILEHQKDLLERIGVMKQNVNNAIKSVTKPEKKKRRRRRRRRKRNEKPAEDAAVVSSDEELTPDRDEHDEREDSTRSGSEHDVSSDVTRELLFDVSHHEQSVGQQMHDVTEYDDHGADSEVQDIMNTILGQVTYPSSKLAPIGEESDGVASARVPSAEQDSKTHTDFIESLVQSFLENGTELEGEALHMVTSEHLARFSYPDSVRDKIYRLMYSKVVTAVKLTRKAQGSNNMVVCETLADLDDDFCAKEDLAVNSEASLAASNVLASESAEEFSKQADQPPPKQSPRNTSATASVADQSKPQEAGTQSSSRLSPKDRKTLERTPKKHSPPAAGNKGTTTSQPNEPTSQLQVKKESSPRKTTKEKSKLAPPDKPDSSHVNSLPQRKPRDRPRTRSTGHTSPEDSWSTPLPRSSKKATSPLLKLDDVTKERLLDADWQMMPAAADSVAVETSDVKGFEATSAVSTDDAQCQADSVTLNRAERQMDGTLDIADRERLLTCRCRSICEGMTSHTPRAPAPGRVDTSASTDGDLEQSKNGLEFLQECFSEVSEDDLVHILEQCGSNTTWAVNLLLDSGYQLSPLLSAQMTSAAGGQLLERTLSTRTPPTLTALCDAALEKQLFSIPPLADNRVEGREEEFILAGRNGSLQSSNEPTPVGPEIADLSTKDTGSADNITLEKDVELRLPAPLVHKLAAIFNDASSGATTPGDVTMLLNRDVVHQLNRSITSAWKNQAGGPARELVLMQEMAQRIQLEEDRQRALSVFTDSQTSSDCASSAGSPVRRKQRSVSPLLDIMAEQAALENSRKEYLAASKAHSQRDALATRLKVDRLEEMYPLVAPEQLRATLEDHGYFLEDAIQYLEALRASTEAARTSCAPGSEHLLREMQPAERNDVTHPLVRALSTENELAELREESREQRRLREESQRKSVDAYNRGMGVVAAYYSQQGRLHTLKMRQAMSRTSSLIACQTYRNKPDSLDLHGLRVEEALSVLELVLVERQRAMTLRPNKKLQQLSVITGRGVHSVGGVARIKPAVVRFLKTNNYRFRELQPGLLRIFLGASHGS